MFNLTGTAGDNFYEYVNKDWMDANPIPDDYSSWGTFELLGNSNQEKQLKLIENISEKFDSEMNSGGVNVEEGNLSIFWKKTEDLYKRNDKRGFKNFLDNYRLHASYDNFYKMFGLLMRFALTPFFSFYNSQDAKNTKINLPHFHAGGLGLPDRDYYLEESKEEHRTKYKEYMGDILRFSLEKEDVEKEVQFIYNFEEELAKIHFTKVQKRDPELRYNKFTLGELKGKYGDEFDEFLKEVNFFSYHQDIEEKVFIVDNVAFYDFLFGELKKMSKEDKYLFLQYYLTRKYGAYFCEEIDDLNFNFYSKFLGGQKEKKPLWKRRLGLLNAMLGELFGKYYVREYFDETSKGKADLMVKYILEAFRERLTKLKWMTEETKEKAYEKLDSFKVKIGYPSKWEDYSSLVLCKYQSIDQIAILINEWEMRKELREMYHPPDMEEWEMNPQDVNAYYHPLKNEIVFPAAIMQPPFFSAEYDEALNYGGIGGVIAHEITHGFDDSGRKFDKDGNLNAWWNERDIEDFEKLIVRIKEQFSSEVVCGEKVNGELTCGENIADDGGIKISMHALEEYFRKNPEKYEEKDGFTPYQRFFLSWARVWKGNIREEYAKQLIKVDPHSPRHLRVNIPLSNCDKFYEVFNVKEGSKMYRKPEDRFDLW